ncbi:uroporphyrinogen-III synthase [Thalassotalea euphylliae]|uniref:Uroporphyrinogen-III synthase n=1 Tax=Thalassotalea euphylliae TaxID=1655234 RepID=A0A3E0TXJ4_9GAMM|nr:uroporphyrinogen-III synthase [Thalassotalea euphylliae]REL28685.1 uroporphyrinogen-III synthase [Thalassotalea euphylliae]
MTNIDHPPSKKASNERHQAKLLITRPAPQAEQLAQQLQRAGYQTFCQPLFTYQAGSSQQTLSQLLSEHSPEILIFVSKAAVEWANQILPLPQWAAKTVIAVGNATQGALIQAGITQVICPTQHDSEGMLALPALAKVSNRNILIIRGNGGRELLANELIMRGANVRYFESYYRQWLEFDQRQACLWREQGVTGIIVTSQALLESAWQLTQNVSHPQDKDNFWQNTCLWLVASERIADTARRYGLQQVVCTQGASDQAIMKTLNQLERTNDR